MVAVESDLQPRGDVIRKRAGSKRDPQKGTSAPQTEPAAPLTSWISNIAAGRRRAERSVVKKVINIQWLCRVGARRFGADRPSRSDSLALHQDFSTPFHRVGAPAADPHGRRAVTVLHIGFSRAHGTRLTGHDKPRCSSIATKLRSWSRPGLATRDVVVVSGARIRPRKVQAGPRGDRCWPLG